MRSVIVSLSMVFAIAALAPCAANARSVKRHLHPTGVDPDAQGVAVASIHAKAHRGKFRVSARNLNPGATFGISVAGVRIGSLTTNAAGSGAARFSSSPGGTTQFLGVDPRGKLVEVSDDQGEDVLKTKMSGNTDDQGDVQCCLADDDDDGTECEETTADECTAEGGTNMGTGSCFPNPCPTSPPTPDIQCCEPDEDGPGCEEKSAAECSADGGVNMGTGSCEPNPCASTPPNTVRCCISEDEQGDQGDQGDQKGDAPTVLRGKRHGARSTRVPVSLAKDEDEDDDRDHPEPPECEQLTAAHCSEEGGTAIGPGSCEPNPCVSSPSGAFLN